MPTELDLINAEKIASVIFIASDFLSLASAFKAEQAELEKGQNTSSSSTSSTATIESNQLVVKLTVLVALGYLIFLLVAIIRGRRLIEQIESGTLNVARWPTKMIITSLSLSALSAVMRLPAVGQRLFEAESAEAEIPVIL